MARFEKLALPGIVPDDAILHLDTKLQIVRLEKRLPTGDLLTIEQVVLLPKEYRLFLLLCETAPGICKNVQLFSVAYGCSLEEATLRLHVALQEDGSIQALMHHPRNLLSRLRSAIVPLNLDIKTVLRDGCFLQALDSDIASMVDYLRTRTPVRENKKKQA